MCVVLHVIKSAFVASQLTREAVQFHLCRLAFCCFRKHWKPDLPMVLLPYNISLVTSLLPLLATFDD
jgi:hypothetical protein